MPFLSVFRSLDRSFSSTYYWSEMRYCLCFFVLSFSCVVKVTILIEFLGFKFLQCSNQRSGELFISTLVELAESSISVTVNVESILINQYLISSEKTTSNINPLTCCGWGGHFWKFNYLELFWRDLCLYDMLYVVWFASFYLPRFSLFTVPCNCVHRKTLPITNYGDKSLHLK